MDPSEVFQADARQSQCCKQSKEKVAANVPRASLLVTESWGFRRQIRGL